MRILLVEDDDDIREAMAEVLEAECHAVTPARNGAEALTFLRGNLLPDAVVLDLSMPVMNGRAFRVEQLKDPALARIPVVLMTGAHESLSGDPVLRVAAILPKPFDPPTLIETLVQLLPAA